MDKLFVEIGGRIRELRKALKLTQAEVAEKAGIDSSFYGQIERGANIPSLKTFLAIAAALRAEPGELLPSYKGKSGDATLSAVDSLLGELKPEKRRFVLTMVRDIVAELKK